MAELNCTISAESVVCDALNELAQKALKEHRICIESVDFSWDHFVTDGINWARLREVKLHIRSNAIRPTTSE